VDQMRRIGTETATAVIAVAREKVLHSERPARKVGIGVEVGSSAASSSLRPSMDEHNACDPDLPCLPNSELNAFGARGWMQWYWQVNRYRSVIGVIGQRWGVQKVSCCLFDAALLSPTEMRWYGRGDNPLRSCGGVVVENDRRTSRAPIIIAEPVQTT